MKFDDVKKQYFKGHRSDNSMSYDDLALRESNRNRLISYWLKIFPSDVDAEIAALKRLLEAGKERLNATGYELTGLTSGMEENVPDKHFGYATAIFYKAIKNKRT